MAFASKDLIKILNRIKPPYNISGLTQETVLAAMDNYEKVKSMTADILSERQYLKSRLESLAFVNKIHPSDSNFLLVKMPNANLVYDELIDKKVIVRNRSKVLLCEDCLRITVGIRAENDRLVEALSEIFTSKN
jgi:histidinol-phosphate aminotransferase